MQGHAAGQVQAVWKLLHRRGADLRTRTLQAAGWWRCCRRAPRVQSAAEPLDYAAVKDLLVSAQGARGFDRDFCAAGVGVNIGECDLLPIL